MPPRVIHVTPYLLPARVYGGPAVAVHNYALGAAIAGANVTVLTTSAAGRRDLTDGEISTAGERPYDARYLPRIVGISAFFSPALARALWRALPGCDIVHVMGMWTFPAVVAMLSARLRRRPYVVSIHGCLNPWGLKQRAFLKRLMLAAGLRRLLRSAAALHFTTEMEREIAPHWARECPHIVVGNGFEFPEYDQGEGREQLRGAWGAGAGGFVWGIVGRIHHEKGFDTLIPAFAEHLKTHPDSSLVVIGPDTGYLARLREDAATFGIDKRMTVTGEISSDDLWRAYGALDALVMPSYRENFGNTAVEAMACGVPVVVSEQVNLAPEIKRAGAGLVVAKQTAALAAAMEKMRAGGVREPMGKAAREFARSNFGVDKVGRALVDAYERIIPGGEKAK